MRERLELGNLELFDRQLKNNTGMRTCMKPHLKLTKIPTRIESFKEPKTQFGRRMVGRIKSAHKTKQKTIGTRCKSN
jgi:hypothetical protein